MCGVVLLTLGVNLKFHHQLMGWVCILVLIPEEWANEVCLLAMILSMLFLKLSTMSLFLAPIRNELINEPFTLLSCSSPHLLALQIQRNSLQSHVYRSLVW